MKDSKYCKLTACCWGFRHELLGLILLVIATILTIATCNSFGIVAMFIVGGLLCCYKHLSCHVAHGDAHCHMVDEELEMLQLKEEAISAKKTKK